MICKQCGNNEVDYQEYENMLEREEREAFGEKVYLAIGHGDVDEATYPVDNCPRCYIPVGWLQYVTNAPVCYDGFGTRTLREIPFPYFAQYKKDDVYRLVVIDPGAERWQTMRYSSGNKLALTLDRAMAEFGLTL